MPAILKSKHHQFCNWLQGVKAMQPVPDHSISELEDELEDMYKNYQQKLDELRQVIQKYQEKQKTIKNEIKRIRKYSLIL
jgi:flagellar capping protein FliD